MCVVMQFYNTWLTETHTCRNLTSPLVGTVIDIISQATFNNVFWIRNKNGK